MKHPTHQLWNSSKNPLFLVVMFTFPRKRSHEEHCDEWEKASSIIQPLHTPERFSASYLYSRRYQG
jgi:hypothetical protein